jgi:hypothetical protein
MDIEARCKQGVMIDNPAVAPVRAGTNKVFIKRMQAYVESRGRGFLPLPQGIKIASLTRLR